MSRMTKRGKEVASDLIGQGVYAQEQRKLLEVLISERTLLASEYTRIQERWCSEDMNDVVRKSVETRESKIEENFRAWIARFPSTVKGRQPYVKFTGDPRGHCVRIVIPGEPHLGNTWGKDGEFGL